MSPFTLPEFKRTLWAVDRRGQFHYLVAHCPENHPNQQLITKSRGMIFVYWSSGRLYDNGPDCGSDLVSVLGGKPEEQVAA